MGHPYNYTQQIAIHNLSKLRFVGTEIQKNLFYGRDIPVVRYEYTFEQKNIRHDLNTYKYDFLTSGDFVQLYVDGQQLKAEPMINIQGEVIDYPTFDATWSGMEQGLQKDRPLLAPNPSGWFDYIDLDRTEKRFLYKESYVVRIDFDRPLVGPNLNIEGKLNGLYPDNEAMGYYFLTGSYHGNNYIPPHVPVEHSATATEQAKLQYYFHVGTYDGPQT